MSEQQKDSNFGFQKVSTQEKRSLVDSVFSDVANKYDIMNDLMSLGIHRIWKNTFCSMIHDFNGKIIDVAGGTGDIAFRIKEIGKKRNCDPDIVICDINNDMLQLARDKAINKNILHNIDFVHTDAEQLPFPDNSFDYYTIAFGIRNVVSINNVLKEAYRVLKPTGKFLCLEFSKIENECLNKLYELYSFNIMPKIGKFVTNNQDAYRYLAESIDLFYDQDKFKTMIQQSGFSDVKYINLTFGIAAIHYGFKS